MTFDQLWEQARQLSAQGRNAECVAAFEQLRRQAPDHAGIRIDLAQALALAGRTDEADKLAREAVAHDPNSHLAMAAMGQVELARHRPDLAIPYFERALQIAPSLSVIRRSLGICFQYLGRRREARACFESECFLNPTDSFGRLAIAFESLAAGESARGWHEYEWRWKTYQLKLPPIPRPRWDGRDLSGKNILVYGEQGIGDAVQLLRLLPLLKTWKNARAIHFTSPKPIRELTQNAGLYDEWLAFDRPVNIGFDTFTPLISLPWLLGLHDRGLPEEKPYLKPDPARSAKWKPIIDAIPSFKIGIAWQGSPGFFGDGYRSIALKHFETLARIPGVSLISLQRVNGLEQIAANGQRLRLIELNGLDAEAAFVDTAAVLPHLDLVVTCDSALGHIAGAIGVPTFLALSIGHDWRWEMKREDTPWYPSIRLFRQPALNDWPSVFERMAAVIREGMTSREVLAPPRSLLAGNALKVEIEAGELLDKITILELKLANIKDATRRENVLRELKALTTVRDHSIPASPALDEFVRQLAAVNLTIWNNEERMRAWAKAENFGPEYVVAARSSAQNNDRRATIQNEINDLLGSRISEDTATGWVTAVVSEDRSATF